MWLGTASSQSIKQPTEGSRNIDQQHMVHPSIGRANSSEAKNVAIKKVILKPPQANSKPATHIQQKPRTTVSTQLNPKKAEQTTK